MRAHRARAYATNGARISSLTCSACGDTLVEDDDAVTIDGLRFHALCYALDRYGNRWREDVETLADVPDASSVVFEAIATRGLEIAGYI